MEGTKRLTGFRKDRRPGQGPEQAITAQEQLEFVLPLRKSVHEFRSRNIFSCFSAKTDLLINQPDRVLRTQLWTIDQNIAQRLLADRSPRRMPSHQLAAIPTHSERKAKVSRRLSPGSMALPL